MASTGQGAGQGKKCPRNQQMKMGELDIAHSCAIQNPYFLSRSGNSVRRKVESIPPCCLVHYNTVVFYPRERAKFLFITWRGGVCRPRKVYLFRGCGCWSFGLSCGRPFSFGCLSGWLNDLFFGCNYYCRYKRASLRINDPLCSGLNWAPPSQVEVLTPVSQCDGIWKQDV